MRRLLIVALVAALGFLPTVFASKAYAQAEPALQTSGAPSQEHRLLAAGAGAILGILFFNIVTQPFGTVPWAIAPLAPNPKDLAVGSRILAALTGGTGAIVGHFLYHYTH